MQGTFRKILQDAPLRHKLNGIIVGTAGLVLLISSAVFFWLKVESFKTSLTDEVQTLAQVIGTNSISAIAFDDSFAGRSLLAALKIKSDVTVAYLLTPDGTVFADYKNSDTDFSKLESLNVGDVLLRLDINPEKTIDFEEDVVKMDGAGLTVAHTIARDGVPIGLIVIHAGLDSLDRAIALFAGFVALILLSSLALALILSNSLREVIVAPLDVLLKTMHQLSNEVDYTVRAPITSRDEIGQVVHGFNDMIEQLEKREKLLEQHRNHLQTLVDERTSELLARNEDLKNALSELEVAKKAVESASESKSQFFAKISHELRTPLNSIIGFSEILTEEVYGPLGNKTYVDYSTEILDSGKHLLSLINDILDMSKIEAGSFEIHEEVFDLSELLMGCIRALALRADKTDITMAQHNVADLPYFYADRRSIKQIMLNLLSNAVKFTPEGGKITVITKKTGDIFTIAVQDTGIGIKPEDLPRMMQPFQQASNAHSRSHEGTGLGLSITKSLMELHGGKIEIASVYGEGTTILLQFKADRLRDRDSVG